MHYAVSDGERPYFPRCELIFRADNGICRAMKLSKPDEDTAQVAGDMLLNTLTDFKCRPGALLISRHDLGAQLGPLASQLGIKIKRVSRLPSAEEFRDEMAAHIRQGGQR
jgi:hypothetical protein